MKDQRDAEFPDEKYLDTSCQSNVGITYDPLSIKQDSILNVGNMHYDTLSIIMREFSLTGKM